MIEYFNTATIHQNTETPPIYLFIHYLIFNISSTNLHLFGLCEYLPEHHRRNQIMFSKNIILLQLIIANVSIDIAV